MGVVIKNFSLHDSHIDDLLLVYKIELYYSPFYRKKQVLFIEITGLQLDPVFAAHEFGAAPKGGSPLNSSMQQRAVIIRCVKPVYYRNTKAITIEMRR